MIPFFRPLHSGILVRRYKRFLADIILSDGTEITAHCPNSGAMTSCCAPGAPVLVSLSSNPDRKLPYTWEMIKMESTWVGVNTSNPNAVVKHLVEGHHIAELTGYSTVRSEVTYGREGRSRIDLLLQDPSSKRPDCYVEIKNTTMRVGDHGAFPDAVSTRGQKHLEELMHVAALGHRAVILFFMGRDDCLRFRPADEVDPRYGVLLRQAVNAGVEALACRINFTPEHITYLGTAPIDLT